MPYASVQDMVDRFGNTEVLRLSDPEDRSNEVIVAAKVELAIADAGALVDDYVRGRYLTPLAPAPASIVRATCVLARYDLAKGERTEPTEQMRLDRKEVISWLEGIAAGRVNLDVQPASGSASSEGADARISDREAAFTNDTLRGW